ncbi:hypothetical protein [Streptomyces kebangsaanensis]|uniref:hypothetical protein n=1 Tax=Streptomyces kebangsaanensis TaxID=864058 RepID=UPI00093DBD7C|nr:hypothetical protein [Streptomyces kebangsaanensis]
MFIGFRVDHRGLAEILKSERVREAIGQAAERAATSARSQLPSRARVSVQQQITDRQRATVLAAGTGSNNHAELIRAARAAGLEVHEYPPSH